MLYSSYYSTRSTRLFALMVDLAIDNVYKHVELQACAIKKVLVNIKLILAIYSIVVVTV